MHHQQQRLATVRRLDQRDPQRGVLGQVRRPLGELEDQGGQVAVPGVEDLQPWPRHRYPADLDAVGGEHRPQRLVPRHHQFEGPRQRVRVEAVVRVQREGVTGRARVPVHRPLPTLHRRQRVRGRRGGRQRRTTAGVDDRQLGQLGHGRRVEHLTDAQLRTEFGADPADQLHGGHRVPAEVEEVVVHAHRRQVQDLREQAGDHPLPLGARRDVAGQLRPVRRGQRLAVQLAVRGERQRPSSTMTTLGTM